MQQFREVIDECGFMDLGFECSKFTWSKHFEDGRSIWERLDRYLVINSWFMRFASSRVFHLTCMSSNHVPILISLSGLIPLVQKNYFVSNKWDFQIQVVRMWCSRLGVVGVGTMMEEIF